MSSLISYSSHDTICLYTSNMLVKSEIETLARANNLKVFYADCESNLIAVPYLPTVVDLIQLSLAISILLNIFFRQRKLNL